MINYYKSKARRNSESQSDDGESKCKNQSFADSADVPQSELEEECSQRANDNNNQCNSYLVKNKHECALSYRKNEDGHTVMVNRQELQNKPVLKFSVNAILGSDHGKSSSKPGKRKSSFDTIIV